MKRLFPLVCIIFLSVNMCTLALAQEKALCCLLQSITQTTSLDSSLKRLDFSYDSNKRLTEEIVAAANSDIHLKELEYEGRRLKALSYSQPMFIQPLHDVVDKCFFYWEGDDVIAISFNNGSQLVGYLKFEYREEKCNSPLIYAHILYWLPNPYNFWHETWVNHAALFHCRPLTPARLIDSCRWSTGVSQVFSYTFDNYGNPLSMCYDSPKNDFEYFTITERFTWKEF